MYNKFIVIESGILSDQPLRFLTFSLIFVRLDRGGGAGGGRYVERIADTVADRRVVDRFDRNDRGGRLDGRTDLPARGGRVDDRRDIRDVGRHDDRTVHSDRGGRDQRFDR